MSTCLIVRHLFLQHSVLSYSSSVISLQIFFSVPLVRLQFKLLSLAALYIAPIKTYVDLISCSVNRNFHTKLFFNNVDLLLLERKVKDRTLGIGKTRILFSKLSLLSMLIKCRNKKQSRWWKIVGSSKLRSPHGICSVKPLMTILSSVDGNEVFLNF